MKLGEGGKGGGGVTSRHLLFNSLQDRVKLTH